MDELENTTAQEKPVMGNITIEMYIKETAKWGKFLAIVGYVFLGIMVLIAFVMILGLSALGNIPGQKFPMTILGMIYLLLTGVNFIPVTYLYRYSTEAGKAVENNDEENYTLAFANLKSLFKFIGIFTIIVLVFYALVIVLAAPMAMLFK